MRSIFFIGLILASVPIVMRRPICGIAIYAGFNVIRPEMLFWGGTTGSYVFSFYYGLILLSTFLKGNFQRIGLSLQREFILMLWLALAIFASIIFSTYPSLSRQYYFAFELVKAFGICLLLYVNIKTFDDINKIENVLLYCFAFMGVWGIEQQFRGNERLEGLGGNAWGDSNGVAGMFVLILPVALAKVFVSEKRRDLWVSIGIVSIMVILIVCTKSRGGAIGLVACLLSFGFFTRRTGKIIKLAFVLTLVAMPFVTDSYLDRFKTIEPTDNDNIDGSARSRLILWQAGLMVFGDNPIVGTGFMTYPEAKMKYESKFLYLEDDFRSWVFRTENKKVTHNTYVQLLSDCGLLGALPFVLLIIGCIYKCLKVRSLVSTKSAEENIMRMYMSGIVAGITGYSVCIIFMDSLTGNLFYYQVAISGILYKIIYNDKLKMNYYRISNEKRSITS